MAACVGLSARPALSHRKSTKRGFEFSLMVVGESGLGKSTLISSLFSSNIYAGRDVPTATDKLKKTVNVEASTVEIEEKGVRLKLTIVDTPGFGDNIDCTKCIQPIVNYVDSKFEAYFKDESGLNRRNISDNRVHCCFYFINPSGHGLRPIDISFMKALHDKVNIVPLIAKADTLTKEELARRKVKILEEIRKNEIVLYELPDCDSDEDEEYKKMTQSLQERMPFAIIGSNSITEVNGKQVRVRQYPWGVVEVENEEHSDFIKLRTMITTYMQDLKDVTGDYLYESYRAQKLSGSSGTNSLPKHRGRTASFEKIVDDTEKDKDRMLREKEEELRRMQEMIAKIQEQMRQQQQQPH